MRQTLSADAVSFPTRFEKLCRMGSSTKGLISEIYRILVDPIPSDPLKHAYMTKWESYLGT